MSDLPIVLRSTIDDDRRGLLLSEAEQRHLCRVLRLRAGDGFEIRDGRGLRLRCRLTRVGRRDAKAEILDRRQEQPAPGPLVLLALPLLKGKRLDWALEKGTELGVAGFHLYRGRHAVVKREKAPERYGEILRAAFCQSQRLFLPELDGPASFPELLARAVQEGWRQCWADEQGAGQGQEPLNLDARPILAWVGPEGGFADEEREALAGCCEFALDLGPQRLRAETAALATACRLLLPPALEKKPEPR